MSETAVTCPTLRRALEKIRTLTGGGCYDCMMAEPNRCPRCAEIDETVDAALATPAPDPLTALERAVVEAAIAQHTAAKRYDTLSDTARRGEVFTDFMRATDTVARLVDQLKAARAANQEAPR